MHAALMPNGRVVFLDKVENYTQLRLPDGQLAYSAEYNPATNEVVGLAYKTNAFCAGGSFLENGTLLSVGGNAPLTWLDPTVGDGFRAIRYLTRSATSDELDGHDWSEPGNQLDTPRWYPTVQTLSDGTIFVASGSLNGLDPAVNANNNPTYEIFDREGISHGGSIRLPLLVKAQPYYMYPFVHLLPDDNLFIFSAKSSEVFSVVDNVSKKTLPDLPGDYRTYPNTGGSVLLPLSSGNNWTADILICGGGAYQDITSPTDPSCGRIQPLAEGAQWEMDAMPEGRGMVEGTLLPDGSVLWLNGASSGAQGYGLAKAPTLEALIYTPDAALGSRWTRDASSDIPRLYHSVALLLLDGTVMIAGSNPSEMPVLDASTTNPFPTEFRVEIYTPPYFSGTRPTNISVSKLEVRAGDTFEVSFISPVTAKAVTVVLHHGGFVTHSVHMGQRMLSLDTDNGFEAGSSAQKVTVSMPDSYALVPPGPYVVYVVLDGVPGVGKFLNVRATGLEQLYLHHHASSKSTSTESTTEAEHELSGRARQTDAVDRIVSAVPMAPHTELSEIGLQLDRPKPTESTEYLIAAPELTEPYTAESQVSLDFDGSEPTPVSRHTPQPMVSHIERMQLSLAFARGESTPAVRQTPVPMAPHTERPAPTQVSTALPDVEHIAIQPSTQDDTTSTLLTPDSCQEPGTCRKTPVPQRKRDVHTGQIEHPAPSLMVPEAHMAKRSATISPTGETAHTEHTMTGLMTPDWHGNDFVTHTLTATFASYASVSSGANTARNAEPSFASPSACGVLADLGCSLGGNGAQLVAGTSEIAPSDTSSLSASTTVQVASAASDPSTRSWSAAGGNPVVTSPPAQHVSAAADKVSGSDGNNAGGYGKLVAAALVGFVAGVVLL